MTYNSFSIRKRVFLLLVGVGAAFLVLVLGWRHNESRRVEGLLAEKKLDTEHLLGNILELRRKPIVNFVRDYTFWDEIVTYVAKPDPAWAKVNLDESGATFGVDGVFLFDLTGKQVYSFDAEEPSHVTEMPLRPTVFAESFGDAEFMHAFVRKGEELFEVHGATIHGSDDPSRVGQRFGYFFAVKRWDDTYVDELRPLTGCAISFDWPVEHRVSNGHPASSKMIVVEHVLSGFRGESVAVLTAQCVMPAFDLLSNATARAVSLFIAFFVLALAAMAIGLYRFFDLPLTALAKSLRRTDPEPLAPLLGESHEFGHLARLMRDFFEQRAAMLQEVERRRASEIELARVCRRNEEAAQARMRMFAQVSHEIRSPLNGVIGTVDLLADTQLDPQQREFVSTVQGSSHALLDVLNDVLDLAKIEEGKVVLETIEFDLRVTIEEVVALFAPQAQAKGLDIACVIPADCPTALSGDPGRIRQILINLVGNAIKYTTKGDVAVEVKHHDVSDEAHHFEIIVRDSGIGIPRERLDAIFEAYEQADASDARRFGGTGLGLTISRHLARLLGGDLSVESELGRGSAFGLTLDIRRSSDASARSDEFAGGSDAIVFSLHALTRRAISEQLRALGLRIVECSSPSETSEALRTRTDAAGRAIVVFDHRRESGSLADCVARWSHQVERLCVRPIVIASMADALDYAKRGSESNVTILARPVGLRIFAEAIARGSDSLPRDAVGSAAAKAHPIQLTGARVLIAESYPPMQRILLDHASELGLSAVLAADGRAALSALQSEEFDAAVIDLRLIALDGLELVSRWREIERGRSGRRLPVIALNAPERDRQRWTRAGVDDAVRGTLTRESLAQALGRRITREPVLASGILRMPRS